MKKVLRFFLALSLVALMASPALALLPAVDFTGVTVDFTNGNWSLGWEFSTKTAYTFGKLGFYDDLKNGLTQNHAVGVYDSMGNLLVSTVVTTSDPLVGFFRWHPVPTTTLAAGQTYEIMAVTGDENYTWSTIGFTVDPRINFIQDAYFDPPSGVLAFPNAWGSLSGGDGFFGPNMAPLPSTLLFLGSGLVGLIGMARRRLS